MTCALLRGRCLAKGTLNAGRSRLCPVEGRTIAA
jgi:hypothetical protein